MMAATITDKCPADEETRYLYTCKSFFSNTSIHGLKYITEDRSHCFERLFWIISFVLGSLFSAYFRFGMWQKWTESPVLISFESTSYPIEKLPFPAVTICSVNKVSRKALEDLQSSLNSSQVSAQDVAEFTEYMFNLDLSMNDSRTAKFVEVADRLNLTVDKLIDLMKNVTPSYNSLFVLCQWEGAWEDCRELFRMVFTEDGICYGFNVETQNHASTDKLNQIRSAKDAGIRWGLSLVLNADLEDYSTTSWDFTGFKVLVQDPKDLSYVGDLGLNVSPGFETNIAVKGYSVTASEAVSSVAPEKRKCALENEIQLKFFDSYSRANCEIECSIEMILKYCGCVPFYFALRANKNVPACNFTVYPCLTETEPLSTCTCYPSCSDVGFDTEVSIGLYPGHNFARSTYGDYLADKLNMTLNQTDTILYFKQNIAKVNIFFKKNVGLRYIMDVRYSWEDFVSAMGGLLGLGIGFSLIRAVEIFYFVTLRWCFRNCAPRRPIANDAAAPKNAIYPIATTG